MTKYDWDTDDLRQRQAFARTKLTKHERLIGIILGFLTFLAVLAVGLLIGHVAGVPSLAHGS
ncbi:hypothetical protein AA309_10175 [Microvirga vignae]|uniref:Uncharacterized protein n=1 Tax=Microvirga vignae TaxID=1225564 RepID=A0A0H1RD66_9HYPH|nr:hypothetical protein [Microvirga vignae]KLK93155.1 hypothetical protein AA309_10175 [Microvirga vignae]